jgi:hypothetical protein
MDEDLWWMMGLENRRDSVRQPTGIQIVLLEHCEEGTHEAILINISRTGMQLTSTHCFPEDCEATVHPPEDFTNLQPLRMRIQRRREHAREDENWFEYGLCFVDEEDRQRHAWYLNLRLSE